MRPRRGIGLPSAPTRKFADGFQAFRIAQHRKRIQCRETGRVVRLGIGGDRPQIAPRFADFPGGDKGDGVRTGFVLRPSQKLPHARGIDLRLRLAGLGRFDQPADRLLANARRQRVAVRDHAPNGREFLLAAVARDRFEESRLPFGSDFLLLDHVQQTGGDVLAIDLAAAHATLQGVERFVEDEIDVFVRRMSQRFDRGRERRFAAEKAQCPHRFHAHGRMFVVDLHAKQIDRIADKIGE